MVLVAGLGTPAAASDAEIAQALRSADLRPVEPATAAADASLRALDGSQARVSDSLGRWLLLTFVASWCGPCVQEMPTLDAVAQSELGEAIDVVGIAIDRDADALEAFLGQVDVSFPVYWDPTGALAQVYRARSIPLTYVIDPTGRIRGVARGARDWSAFGPLYELLLAEIPPSAVPANTSSAYRDDLERVELPIRLTPPEARVAGPVERTVRVGTPFEIEIAVTWAGNFDEYLLHPPRIVLPEDVEQRDVAAETSGEGGGSVVTYRVSLEATAAGRFALDPIELRYTPRGDEEPLVRQIDGVTVAATSAGVTGWMVGGLGLLAATLGLVWWMRARQRAPDSDTAVDPWQRAAELMAESDVHSVRGDRAATLERLLMVVETVRELEPRAEEDAQQIANDLEDLHQRCQFGGERLSSQELSRIRRRVERWFTGHAPSAAAAERERLEID